MHGMLMPNTLARKEQKFTTWAEKIETLSEDKIVLPEQVNHVIQPH